MGIVESFEGNGGFVALEMTICMTSGSLRREEMKRNESKRLPPFLGKKKPDQQREVKVELLEKPQFWR